MACGIGTLTAVLIVLSVPGPVGLTAELKRKHLLENSREFTGN